MERFEESAFCREIEAFRLPRYADLPDFRLYIDQLIALVEKTLANGLTKEVALAESVAAPVYAGDTLGQLTVRDAAGNTVAELPILAGEDVGHVTFVQMLGRCLARGFCMGPQS